MSVTSPNEEQGQPAPSKLIIQDQPYQFLPNLAAIYGDSCALIIQQLYFKIEVQPYFEGEDLLIEEFEGLKWIQIFGFMWWDTLEGICRHLPRSTFYTYRKALEKSGALKIRDTLGKPEVVVYSSKKDEGAKWYALDHRIINEHDRRYREEFEVLRAQRRAARQWLRKNKGREAHWRPAPGEDTSKQIEFCRELNAELCAEREVMEEPPLILPSVRKPRGKSVKKAHSQNENSHVSPSEEPKPTVSPTSNEGHSQIENGHVLPSSDSQFENDESQIETVSESQVETKSESQVETPMNPNLRIAPYIDKTELRSKTESLDSTTKDTAPQVSPAEAGSGVVQHVALSSPPTSTHEENSQLGLSGLLASLLPEPTDSAMDLAVRFLEAAEHWGLDCSNEEAARIVARFPISTMSENEMKRLIGTERSKIGLSQPIGGDYRKAMLADLNGLRWLLFTWPGHQADVTSYYVRQKQNPQPKMSGAFCRKWDEETPPAEEWVQKLISEVRYEIRSERHAIKSAKADLVWEQLDAGKRIAFDVELFKLVERMPGNIDTNRARVRVELLNDADFVASLQSAPAASSATATPQSTDAAPAARQASAYQYASEGEARNMLMKAAQFARRIKAGELKGLDAAEDEAIARLFYTNRAAAHFRTLVEAELQKLIGEAKAA